MSNPACTTPEQSPKTEEYYAKLGNQMILDQFNFALGNTWNYFPSTRRKAIVNVAGFVGIKENLILKTSWENIPPVNQNLISMAVIEIMEVGNFIRGALL